MTAAILASLVQTHAAALVLFARQWCESPEDAVQEAFCKLAAQHSLPEDPAAWLFTVTRNVARDAEKRQRRRAKREQMVGSQRCWFAEQQVEGLDAADAVQALRTLPLEQREVIVARLWGGLTLEQFARSAGCSVSTAHRRFEAGIEQIRERLGERCPN